MSYDAVKFQTTTVVFAGMQLAGACLQAVLRLSPSVNGFQVSATGLASAKLFTRSMCIAALRMVTLCIAAWCYIGKPWLL